MMIFFFIIQIIVYLIYIYLIDLDQIHIILFNCNELLQLKLQALGWLAP